MSDLKRLEERIRRLKADSLARNTWRRLRYEIEKRGGTWRCDNGMVLELKDGVLIVIAEKDEFVERSARNIPGVAVLRAAGLNVYDVLRHRNLLLTKEAVGAIETRLAGSEGAGA